MYSFINPLYLFYRYIYLFIFISFFPASEHSSALGKELNELFVAYTENVQRESQTAQTQMESKAAQIEEVK